MIQLEAMNLYSDLMQIKIELLNLFVVSEFPVPFGGHPDCLF